jgi:GNAT superfamily N-acetyltransferase
VVVVDPDRHGEGIGTRLLAEADRRWRLIFDTQQYTPAGLALVTAYEQRHIRR